MATAIVLTDLEQVKTAATSNSEALFKELNAGLKSKTEASFDALVALASVPAAAAGVAAALPAAIELAGEKKPKGINKKAEAAVGEVLAALTTSANARYLADVVLADVTGGRVPVKKLKLQSFMAIVKVAPLELVNALPQIVPVLTEAMWDVKKDVRALAMEALNLVSTNIANKDIEPFIPEMIAAIQKPELVSECVHKLGSTAFVQTVDAPVLAIAVPILLRGFAEKATTTKRLSAKITENMTKLILKAGDTAQFLPVLMPVLEKAKEEIADSECRTVCTNAYKQLVRIQELSKTEGADSVMKAAVVEGIFDKNTKGASGDVKAVRAYLSVVCASMVNNGATKEEIEAAVAPLLATIGVASAAAFAAKVMDGVVATVDDDVIEDETGEVLCDCKFTLAFGTKILLNNTRMKLNRGHRVALVGAQGCGKTALMQAIASDNLDGFPPKSELKTVFVEHSIQGDQSNMSVIEFCLSDPMLIEMGTTEEQVLQMLTECDFTEVMKHGPVTALSGGWKMKLALGRAQLCKPDILLLDEPTNHLDVVNVKWIEDFLLAATDVTSLIVSHDTKFMDNIATQVVHFEQLRLKAYPGNLSAFVEKVPSAQAYYTLESEESLKFQFPKPGHIEGINRRTKHLLSLERVAYTYPTAEKPQFTDVSVRLSMASRVAIVGRNGAGKSTLIRLVTGETVPDAGSGPCWRHPNLKLAYVAQHAFHHIEQHLNKTANEYIRWRFQGGKDKENQKKMNLKLTEEEIALQNSVIEITPEGAEEGGKKKGKAKKEKRQIEKIVSRRKNKKDFDYEVSWVDKPAEMNSWYGRPFLERYGWKKILDEVDRKAVEAMGKFVKPLTMKNVEDHLAGCGLEREFASYTRISALSGGQKVKVVLAAAMWDQPHILLLDEPTNFLDRESLAALAGAINDFEGGVVVITHHREFRDAVCKTSWVMENHKLTVMGDDEDWFDSTTKMDAGPAKEEMTDAFGNTVKLDAKKKLSKKEIKKLKKEYAKIKKAGGDAGHIEDIFIDNDIDF
jgi:elongation factor 3